MDSMSVNLRYYPNATNGKSAGGRVRPDKRSKAKTSAPATVTPIVIKDPDSPASEAQVNYMSGLVTRLAQLDPIKADEADRWIQATYRAGNLNKGLAHRTIDRLKLRIEEATAQPAPMAMEPPVRTVDRFTDVPDGNYAVTTEDGVLAFYRVTTFKPTDRYPFPNRNVQVRASEALYPIRGWAARDTILEKIRQATPTAAGKAYADEIGRCWRCNLTLTDADSRARGMGPTCASK